MKVRRGKRPKQLVDDVKDRIGYSKYAKETHKLFQSSLWKSYGHVV